ncbi:MAG: glycine cleavage system protein GcvH [Candidatus Ancaeobacter aquaticus]|nr:glycine cleavage system protein GcvH [Candidatus Ancaeobacter aquaticus]
MNTPAELKYMKSHECVKVEGANARCGITDYAQNELTDVVFVELPPVGKVVVASEQAAVIESVKTAVDVYTPVSGKIVEVNSELENDPGLINRDPYGQGWIFVVEMTKTDELDGLMPSDDYAKMIKNKA